MSKTMIVPALLRTLMIDISQPVFKGHFPNMPILPGVFIIRFMRKLIEDAYPDVAASGKSFQATKIRFLKPVRPGDILEMQAIVKAESSRASISSQSLWDCRATVQGDTVFTGQLIHETPDA